MATNAPAGDGHRNGAVRKRSQVKAKVMGEEHFTKRSRSSAQGSSWPRKGTGPSLRACAKRRLTNG